MIWQDISSLSGNRFGFWDVSFFSDWKDKQCDYATNAVVHNFYNEKKANWWRTNKFEKFYKVKDYLLPDDPGYRIINGDTLIIGLDKYALMGVSYQLVPPRLFEKYGKELDDDKVIRFKVYLADNQIIWENIDAN